MHAFSVEKRTAFIREGNVFFPKKEVNYESENSSDYCSYSYL